VQVPGCRHLPHDLHRTLPPSHVRSRTRPRRAVTHAICSWRLRREQNLPKLTDNNDLPAPGALDPDLEAQFDHEQEKPVLTPEQQEKLMYHQMKYHKSHTFYRPHETPTHRVSPARMTHAHAG
jgi:hypothetical protein